MQFSTLKKTLKVSDESLTLSDTLLSQGELAKVIKSFNKGNPLVISKAKRLVGEKVIAIKGTTNFAGVRGAEIVAQFSLDAEGNPQSLLRIAMPEGWTFSRSFPDPTKEGTARAELDELKLTEAFLVFASQPGADASGAPLAAGLNVVAELHLNAAAALIDAALGGKATGTLHATVTPPGAEKLPPLPFGGTPWDALQWKVPGIAAEADLGIDLELGEAELSGVRVRFYSPPSTKWMEENRSYRPQRGLAGQLKLAAAGIDAELSGELTPHSKAMQLSAEIAGATFGKLEDLAGLAPGQSLASQLPGEVQDALAAVEGLALTRAVVAFDGTLSASAVSLLGFGISFPANGWTVFPGLEAQVSGVQFMVANPFGAGTEVSALLEGELKVGGQPLEVITQVPNFAVRGELPTEATAPLADFSREQLPGVSLPDLSIAELSFFVEPGESWSVEAAMADEPGWEFEVGPANLTIADILMEFSKQAGGEVEGSVSGLLILDEELSVAAQYDIPGELMLRAQLPELNLSRLVSLFDETGIELPDGFDFSLVEPYVVLDTGIGGERFTAATKVPGLGTLAFTAQREGGKTGVAIGIELEGEASALPGLEALAELESLVGLTEAMLVVSSLEEPGFQLPAMTNFGAPTVAGSRLSIPPQAGGLVRGLNVYAKLSAAKSSALQALANWLGISIDGSVAVSIGVSLPDPAADSKLMLAVETTVEGVSVQGDLGLLMQAEEPGVFFDAVVTASIQGQPVSFGVGVSALPDGLLVQGSMDGTLDFGPVIVSDLAIVVGLDLEGVPTLGFAGTFDVPDASFDGSVAIFLDSTDPAKSLLAGSVNELTLANVAHALAPGVALPSELESAFSRIGVKGLHAFTLPAESAALLDGRELSGISAAFQQYGQVTFPSASDRVLLVVSKPGQEWHLTDLTTMTHYSLTLGSEGIDVALDAQVYIAPQEVRLGDPVSGIVFPQGLHVDGTLDLLITEVRTKVEAGPSGIAAEVNADPIELGPVIKITDATGATGPQLSFSTFEQPQLPPPFNQPHFYLSGRVDVLGLEDAAAELRVDSEGVYVDISNDVAVGVSIELQGSIADAENMLLSGRASIGIDVNIDLGPLGSLPLNDQVGGTVTVQLQGGSPSASFTGELVFQGTAVAIPVFAIPAEAGALTRLADLVVDELEGLMKGLLEDAQKWLEWAKAGIVQGFAEVAKIGQVLAQEFDKSAEEVAGLMRDAGYEAAAVAEALAKGVEAGAEEVLGAMQQAGYGITEAADAVQDAFSLSVNELAGVLNTVGAGLQTITGVLSSLGTPADEIASALESFGTSAVDVAASLKGIGASAEEIGGALESAFSMAGEEAAQVLGTIGESAEVVQHTLESVFGQVGDTAEEVIDEIGDAFESLW